MPEPELTTWAVSVTVTTHHVVRVTVPQVGRWVGDAEATLAMAQVRQMTPEDMRRHMPLGTTYYLTGVERVEAPDEP